MMFSTTTLSGSRSEQQQPCLHVFFSVFWIKIRNHAPGVLGCFARSFFSLLYFLCAIKLQASSVVVCLSVPFFATQVLCCSRADCRLSFFGIHVSFPLLSAAHAARFLMCHDNLSSRHARKEGCLHAPLRRVESCSFARAWQSRGIRRCVDRRQRNVALAWWSNTSGVFTE